MTLGHLISAYKSGVMAGHVGLKVYPVNFQVEAYYEDPFGREIDQDIGQIFRVKVFRLVSAGNKCTKCHRRQQMKSSCCCREKVTGTYS